MATVYLIDDSDDVHHMVTELLKKEHEVIATDDCQQASSYLEKNHVDVVLVDIYMPETSGEEMVKILQENIVDKQLKIVLFSATDEAILRRKARELKVAGAIVKTFEKSLLLAKLKRFLPEKSP